MSTKEVAKYIGGLSVPTVHKLTNAGDLKAFKIGRVLRYRRCDADAFLEECRVNPGDLGHLMPRAQRRANAT